MRPASVLRSSKSSKAFARDAAREQAAQEVLAAAATAEGRERLASREQTIRERLAEVKQDSIVFCYRYAHIESGDEQQPIIPFELWPDQAAVLKQINGSKRVIILKARQLGITWLVLADSGHKMIFVPGYSVIAISVGEEEAKELIRRMTVILKRLPKWMIRHIDEAEPGWPGPVWTATTQILEIHHPNGLISRMRAEDSGKDAGRSLTASRVIFDEWAIQELARDIWQGAGPSANRKHSGQIIGLSTGRPNTLFEEIWDKAVAGKNSFVPIFLPWWSDPSRDEAWYEASKADWPDTYQQEYPATPSEAFSVGSKKFFPEWDYNLHTFVPDDVEIDEHWARFRALDWGFNAPFCCLWIAVDFAGNFWVYRELYESGVAATDAGKWILEIEEEAEEEVDIGPADTQIGEHRGTSGPTIEEEFLDVGIVWNAADKAQKAGWQQIHSRLMAKNAKGEAAPSLRVSRACVSLIKEFKHAVRDKFVADQMSRQTTRHALDALRYSAMERPTIPKKPKENPAPFEKYRERLRKIKRKTSWMARG